MATSISKSPEMDKTKKYDRQLRLWGDHGQAALEASQVCLINATATGTEILKNLILPGIGAFTIVDGNKVTGEDVGNNFFLDKENIGKPRAQIATQLLLELNSDVRGDFVDETLEQLLENNPTFFNSFSVVIACNVNEKTLLDLANKLWQVGVPLIVCRSYGFIGYIRLQIKEHNVIESHPDNAHEDLRIDDPFPGLLKFVAEQDLNKMTKEAHSHTPYIVLLLKFLDIWKQAHNNSMPKNYKEKEEFRNLIREGVMKSELGAPEIEENFEEAVRAVNSALQKTEIPSSVREIFQHESCCNLTSESKPFWILARAVSDFVENEGNGKLPLRGSIPDMTADSDRYIKLQNVYRDQANQDIEAVYRRVQQLLQYIGKPQDSISEADVRLFCKNSTFLRVINCRSLAEEYDTKTAKVQDIVMHLDNPDSEMVFYVLLRAADRFYLEYNRYPGYFNDQVEPDIIKLKSCLCQLLKEWGCGPMAKDDFVHEMCRYGAAELHAVAAFIGGAAAHEIIKVVTEQYVPLNNSYIYNAMSATSATFEL